MAFPASPIDGQVYKNYMYNNTTSAWAKGGQISSGTISPFGGTTEPAGHLLCNGQLANRITHSSLFAVIGTTYGVGDGSTTFNVPDLRGVFLRGAGEHSTMTDHDGNPYDGGSVGDEQNDAIDNITGYIGGNIYSRGSLSASGAFTRTQESDADLTTSGSDVKKGNFTFNASNVVNTDVDTHPANVAVNYIIKI